MQSFCTNQYSYLELSEDVTITFTIIAEKVKKFVGLYWSIKHRVTKR